MLWVKVIVALILYGSAYLAAEISTGESPIRFEDTLKGVFADETQMKQAALRYLTDIDSIYRFGFAALAGGYGRLEMRHGIVSLYDIPLGEIGRKLLVTWSRRARFNDSHSSSVVLSFFEFERKEDGWHSLHSYPGALSAGTWGIPPDTEDIELYALSKEYYGIAVKTAFSTMGWGSEYLQILLPKRDMIYEVLSLRTQNDNHAVGGGRKTEWKISLTFEKNTEATPANIIAMQRGWEEGRRVEHKTKYIYLPKIYRYIKVSEIKKYTAVDKRAEALQNGNSLLKQIHFPTTVGKVLRLLGRADETVSPRMHNPSPGGQWLIWNIDGIQLKIPGDDCSATNIDHNAKVRAGILESEGGVISSVYGVELGADSYFNVCKKLLHYIATNGIKEYKLLASHIRDEENHSLLIRFKDPETGLFVLFYFKNDILVKIYQGTFDIDEAG